MQIVNRAMNESVTIKPSDLFRCQTIAELEQVAQINQDYTPQDMQTEAFDLVDMSALSMDDILGQVSFETEE